MLTLLAVRLRSCGVANAVVATVNDLDDGAARAEMSTAYEGFLPMNRRFLAAGVAWQDKPADISEVVELVNELRPIVGALATLRPRFASYPRTNGQRSQGGRERPEMDRLAVA